MSIHKLSARDGYSYLSRQVAALDATERGHTGNSASSRHSPVDLERTRSSVVQAQA